MRASESTVIPVMALAKRSPKAAEAGVAGRGVHGVGMDGLCSLAEGTRLSGSAAVMRKTYQRPVGRYPSAFAVASRLPARSFRFPRRLPVNRGLADPYSTAEFELNDTVALTCELRQTYRSRREPTDVN